MVPVLEALGTPFEGCGKVLSDLITLVDFSQGIVWRNHPVCLHPSIHPTLG
jgi:hypothetical protein